MNKINIKPLSLNSAYRGRRFSTPELKKYKSDLSVLLPKLKIPQGKLGVYYIFGVSSKNCDGDNLVKAFQDAVAEQYGFNDKKIFKWIVEKIEVKKGEEYVAFTIADYKDM